jgi:hypothetical protein
MKRILFTTALLFVFLFTAGIVCSQEKGGKKDRGSKARGKGPSGPRRPFVGDIAPTFKLKSLDGTKEVDLEKIKGKKPIAIFFGSYT